MFCISSDIHFMRKLSSFNNMHFLFLLFIVHLTNADKIVFTNNGPVQGTFLKEKKVEAFLGIPYAEPPVGPLRFARPVRVSSWKETYSADELPPTCIQGVMKEFEFLLGNKMSEDCLYLNLWVPEESTTGHKPKAVMLFIHGGGFMTGSSNMNVFDGATLSGHGDVIVASINYRVGTLGFFSGFIDEAAGNMGMYDQVMAIRWVKDNAKYFGGDPENIVLFGISAGGFSVSLHMVSPLSRNLFRRAIPQSGTGYHPMFSDDNKELFKGSQLISKLVGCADDDETLKKNPKGVVDCMRTLPAETFKEKDITLFQTFGMLIPRVGDEFLPINPIDSFRKGEFKNSEILIGVTRDEGSLLLPAFNFGIFDFFGKTVDSTTFNETSAKKILLFMTKVEDKKIIQSYLDRVKESPRYTYLNAMSDAYGDYLITCGAVYQADYHSLNGNPVYFYLFDYRSPTVPYAEWMGVGHGEDTQYIFGNPMFHNFTQFGKELSIDMMDIWTSFAKTGNPSIPGGLKWPKYTYENPNYLVLGQRDSLGVRPDNYRCEGWKNFFRSAIDDEVIENLKERCCKMCHNQFQSGLKFHQECSKMRKEL